MEWLNWLILAVVWFVYDKVKKIENKIEDKNNSTEEEEEELSEIIKGLVGQKCKVYMKNDVFGTEAKQFTVLEVDNVWIKLKQINKKGVEEINIFRINEIKEIEC